MSERWELNRYRRIATGAIVEAVQVWPGREIPGVSMETPEDKEVIDAANLARRAGCNLPDESSLLHYVDDEGVREYALPFDWIVFEHGKPSICDPGWFASRYAAEAD